MSSKLAKLSKENTRAIQTQDCFVTPFKVDQTWCVTYDCIDFENYNLSRSKLPYNKLSYPHTYNNW